MQDTDLYRHLLGLETPWTVASVKLDVKEQTVDVFAEHERGLAWPCPECGIESGLHDHAEERVWRHLDSCQFRTLLHARPPRVKCPEHGVRQVRLPWAEPHSRFTALFERLAIDVLRETSVQGACRILRISWDEAWHILERAVNRGLVRKEATVMRYVGIDEKSFRKRHRYASLVCDLDRGVVEYVGEGRNKESVRPFFESLTDEQRTELQAVAMDMSGPYISLATEVLDDAEYRIVFDRFHVMKQMTDSVDKQRRQEHRQRLKTGDAALTGSKYLWISNKENLSDVQRFAFQELKGLELKTARAWAIKEALRELWNHHDPAEAILFWKRWYYWATHSRLEHVIDVARSIKRHLWGVMNYFSFRITNAMSEGMNSVIQTVKQRASGFRNFANFRTAIYFHCGGLDLYPATH
ncbi:MAG: ISL3 family transposase [Phycisphaerae bacterium]|nr:MAG: ISL3 family transposase [Phycisphaerae bacterium]